MAQALLDLLTKQFPGAVLAIHAQHGDETAVIDAARWAEVAQFLRDDPRAEMQMLIDLTAVDFPEREPRFEIVAHLASLSKAHRLRIKTRVGDRSGDVVQVASLSHLWGSANWAERECFDMFGVQFVGHDDLRRILLYPEFQGFPLRKDYDARAAQPLVPYREAENIEKLPPFGPSEGMSFGRQTHDARYLEDDDALSRKPS